MAADTIRKFAELAPLSLDLAHPLIRNKLQTAYMGGFAIGKAGPRLPTKVGSPPLSANNAGVAVRTTHTTGLNLGSVEANANPWTIAAIITPVAWTWVSNGNGLIGVQSTSNDTAYDRGIFFSSGITFSAYVFDGAAKQAAGGGAVVGGRSYRVVAVANGSTIKLYVDGIEAASLATSNTGFTAHSAPKLFIGAIGSASSTDDQAVSYALHTGFAWSAADVKTWSNDPYAVLDRRSRRRLFGVSAGGGSTTVTIGQASEADTAQAITGTAGAVVSIGQASETDAAQALTAAQAATLGQAQETDTAQALSSTQAATIGQASEADTAQALSSGAVVAIGQASETDAAQALSAAQALAIGQAAETDEAQPIAYSSPGVIGQASETDAAQALQSNQVAAIGQASETDAAQPLTAVSSATIGMALEIDTAGAFASSMALAIGQATETDAAQALTVGSPGSGTGATAAEIWDYVLSNGKTAEETAVETHAMLTAMTALLADCPANLLMVLRLLRNKQITDPNTGVFTIYADDSVTPLLQGNLFEDAAGATPYRGQGAERREKLS